MQNPKLVLLQSAFAATPLRMLSVALHSLRQNLVRPAQHELPGQGRQITQCLPQKLLRIDLSLDLIDHTAHLLQAHSCPLSTRPPQNKPVSTNANIHVLHISHSTETLACTCHITTYARNQIIHMTCTPADANHPGLELKSYMQQHLHLYAACYLL